MALDRRAVGRVDWLLRAPGAAWLEDAVAQQLRAIEAAPTEVAIPVDAVLDRDVADADLETGLRLSQEQRDAVMRLLRSPMAVL